MRLLTLTALLFAPLPQPAGAQQTDVLLVRNGDRLTGEVKRLAAGRLDFKTDATKTIPVFWDHVTQLVSGNFFEVVLSSGQRRFGALLEPDGPGVLRVGQGDVWEDVPLHRVASIERLRQTFWQRIKISIDAGFSFTQADKRAELNLASNAQYRTRKWRLESRFDSLFRRQESGVDFDREDIGVSAVRFFSARWLAITGASAQRNTELAIQRRFISFAGGGYHLVRTVEHDLIATAGLAVSSERFTDGRGPTESVEAVFAVGYDLFALGGKDFTARFSAIVYPSLSVARRFRSELSLDLRREVLNDLYVSLRGLHSTDNAGEGGVATTDFNATLAVGWSW